MEQQKVILAKDAEIGVPYLSVGAHYKIVVLKKFGNPEEGYVSSVLVESETYHKPISIAGGTALLPFSEELYVPYQKPKTYEETDMTETTTSEKKTSRRKSFGPRVKMSDIINPLLLEGTHTAGEIADEVIKKIPEKAGEREKLILQIKGPRLYNLTKEAKEKKTKIPVLKSDK